MIADRRTMVQARVKGGLGFAAILDPFAPSKKTRVKKFTGRQTCDALIQQRGAANGNTNGFSNGFFRRKKTF